MRCSADGCKEEIMFDGLCGDHWPGYNLCKVCEDYRCEHIAPTEEDLKDPDFYSCHCESPGCREGFVEGSTSRIVTAAEFRALRRSWGHNVPEPE